MIIPTEIVLTRNSSYAVKGKKNRAYTWPGTALSASTTLFPALKDAVIKNARWVLVWTPQSAMNAGVRLVKADGGPSNIEVLAAIERSGKTPIVNAVNVTQALRDIITGGKAKYIGHQAMGDGTNGCLIYASVIEILWIIA